MVYNTDLFSQESVYTYAETLRRTIKENSQRINSFSWEVLEKGVTRAESQKDWNGLLSLGKEIDLMVLDYRVAAIEEMVKDLCEKVGYLEDFGKKAI